MRGTARRWTRRESFGSSSHPCASANLRRFGVSRAAIKSASKNAATADFGSDGIIVPTALSIDCNLWVPFPGCGTSLGDLVCPQRGTFPTVPGAGQAARKLAYVARFRAITESALIAKGCVTERDVWSLNTTRTDVAG